jgi:hypothetical protein
VTFGSVRRLFSDHPASVGETYLQHGRHALSFGWTMLRGAIACFLHAMFPWAHARTGSNTVIRLYDQYMMRQSRRISTLVTCITGCYPKETSGERSTVSV